MSVKLYKKAMKKLEAQLKAAETDEEKAEVQEMIDGFESRSKELNDEAKEHREAKESAESNLKTVTEKLGITDLSETSINSKLEELKAASSDDAVKELQTQLQKKNNEITTITTERDEFKNQFTELTTQQTQTKIQSKISEKLDGLKVIPEIKSMVSEKLSQGLTIDAEGDIINKSGETIDNIVDTWAEGNKSLISSSQEGGGGGQPPAGGSGTEKAKSSKGILDNFVKSELEN